MKFLKIDLTENQKLRKIIREKIIFDEVINLAAQAGVRYSLDNPEDYLNSNVVGFFNLIEACKRL